MKQSNQKKINNMEEIKDFTYDFTNFNQFFNTINDPINDLLIRYYISTHQFSNIFDIYIEDVLLIFESFLEKDEYVSFNMNKNEIIFVLKTCNDEIIYFIKFILNCLSYAIDEMNQNNNILILKIRNYGNNNDRIKNKEYNQRNYL